MLYSGKKTVFFLIVTMLAIISAAFVARYYFPEREILSANGKDEYKDGYKKETKKRVITGAISDISFPSKVFVLEEGDKEIYLAALPDTKIFGKDNKEIEFDYLRRGFIVFGKSEEVNNSSYILKELRILREPNIIVHMPKAGDGISAPIILRGEARVFENALNYEFVNEDGKILAKNFLTVQSPDIGQYGPFEAEIFFAQTFAQKTILNVFNYSARGGSKENVVKIPLTFNGDNELTVVKAHFSNSELSEGTDDCSKVYPVERLTPKTEKIATAAVLELLRGTTSKERDSGFMTSINQGVRLNKLTIQNGTAKADFNEQLDFQVGGSCRVAAIRAQITETLKQFPTVQNVVISINGSVDDILQP